MTFTERNELAKSYLGKTVTVKIDRPLGSVHPKHPELIYPINYGLYPRRDQRRWRRTGCVCAWCQYRTAKFCCKSLRMTMVMPSPEDEK